MAIATTLTNATQPQNPRKVGTIVCLQSNSFGAKFADVPENPTPPKYLKPGLFDGPFSFFFV